MNTTATITAENSAVDPVAIDTRISDLTDQWGTAYDQHTAACDRARRYVGERKVSRGRSRVWATTNDEAAANLQAALTAGKINSWDVAGAQETLAHIADTEKTMADTRDAIVPLNQVYEAHRWNRFAEVPGGHIHQGLHCAGGTVRFRTRIGWRTDLSGTTVEHAVAKMGPTLCSHCFPSAPLKWTRSAAEVKAEAEADIYCTSKNLSPTERAGVNMRRVQKWTPACETCGATRVPVTANGHKRKHKRPTR